MLAMTMLAMIKILQSKNRDNPKSEMDLVLQGLQLECIGSCQVCLGVSGISGVLDNF